MTEPPREGVEQIVREPHAGAERAGGCHVEAKARLRQQGEAAFQLIHEAPSPLSRVHVLQHQPRSERSRGRGPPKRVGVHDDAYDVVGKSRKRAGQHGFVLGDALGGPVDRDVAEGKPGLRLQKGQQAG